MTERAAWWIVIALVLAGVVSAYKGGYFYQWGTADTMPD